jgi:hypothetical protein
MSVQTTSIQTDKILSQMLNLRDLAQKGSWELAYDEDNDSLYYAPNRIPKGSRLFNFGDEFAVYLDEDSNINGLFIEYFESNFTQHEKEYKKIVTLLDKKTDGYRTSNNNNSDDIKLAENALSGEVLRSFFEFIESTRKEVTTSTKPAKSA